MELEDRQECMQLCLYILMKLMTEKQTYHIVELGKNSTRRDYSKVSGKLELPNLVEIQTESFKWFVEEGIKEVFEDIYPIQNYSGNIRLKYIDYTFGEPKYSISESKYRVVNYAAPLRANMELEIYNEETGEVYTRKEEVFLGDFPMMTPTGTFIINGAERVIVSQIVRSPGAYFDVVNDDKTNKEVFDHEFIPSRGTWLELITDEKKTSNGRLINMSVDRKRKIISSILYKAIGFSLNLEKGEDAFDTTNVRKLLKAMGLHVYDDLITQNDEREFLNIYEAIFTSFLGGYEELVNTLETDKTKTGNEALIMMYENQKSDEVPTMDGAINLMNAKFFDHSVHHANDGLVSAHIFSGAFGYSEDNRRIALLSCCQDCFCPLKIVDVELAYSIVACFCFLKHFCR